MSILEIKNVKKYYENKSVVTKAVDGVTFHVEKGEFIAIIGASGSGKSTLLHLIGGVDMVSEGEVIINGVNLYSLKGDKRTVFRRQHISVIYQFYNLLPVLNVKENIVLPIKLNHQIVDYEKVEFLITLLGLQGKSENLPSQLSGGQQQRVAIARALLSEPLLILADEPTGNLDKKNSEEIIDYLHQINKKFNQTILIVTHDLEIASKADRIFVMEDGKIIEERVS